MNFFVILKAKLFWPGIAPPPFNTVRFLLIRDKTKERGWKTGFLVTDPKDPEGPKPYGNGQIWTYRTEHKVVGGVAYTHWIVTDKKGRWTILISPPHRSNEVRFKIDKRRQIVLLAESWVGALSTQVGGGPMGNCWDLASKVYTRVGFPIPASEDQYSFTIPEPTLKNGCLIFYTVSQFPNASHVAIQVDTGFVVDINCLLVNKDIHKDPSRPNLTTSQFVWRHVLPRGYAASERRSPPELIDLDGE